jgi:hypothetical protein
LARASFIGFTGMVRLRQSQFAEFQAQGLPGDPQQVSQVDFAISSFSA